MPTTLYSETGGTVAIRAPQGLTAGSMASMKVIYDVGRFSVDPSTPGDRIYIDVHATFDPWANSGLDDPAFGEIADEGVKCTLMADVVRTAAKAGALRFSAVCGSPIERVEVRRGRATVQTVRPYTPEELGSRIRIIWECAENRDHSHAVSWSGTLTFTRNAMKSVKAINFRHPQNKLEQVGDTALIWQCVSTTGTRAGIEIQLEDASDGRILIKAPFIELDIDVRQISFEEIVLHTGGAGPKLRLFRLPDIDSAGRFTFTTDMTLVGTGDHPPYVHVTQER